MILARGHRYAKRIESCGIIVQVPMPDIVANPRGAMARMLLVSTWISILRNLHLGSITQ